MPEQSIVLFERLGYWSRQLRPRFRDRPIVWTEVRSPPEFIRAASLSTCPLLLVELGDRPVQALEGLKAGMDASPSALSLVINAHPLDEISILARDFGATQVLSGPVIPPVVFGLLSRWMTIARHRAEAAGWSVPVDSEIEPGTHLGRRGDFFLSSRP